MGNIQEIFSASDIVAVTDPVYPVYVDSNVMAGRSGRFVHDSYEGIEYLPCYEECGFKAGLPSHDPQLIYLCSPNNPTGAALSKSDLTMWVRYAKQTGSVILFDAAYEAYITEDDVPHSIYEIDGAKEVAIEFRSYSKTAGFTGVRCGFCVVPHALMLETKKSGKVEANQLWDRRQCTKFNGVSYIVQRGAEAVYSEEGQGQIQDILSIYKKNARIILEGVEEAGLHASGGINSPYIWVTVPKGMTSWDFFDFLLHEAEIICTPGSGFGPCGEGYVRLTSFNTPELTEKAVDRMQKALARRESEGMSTNLQIGIVGLPNVGKSTLFNAITKRVRKRLIFHSARLSQYRCCRGTGSPALRSGRSFPSEKNNTCIYTLCRYCRTGGGSI